MSKEEVRQIFFELLTEDEEFKQRLTEFILEAVAEKFVQRVVQEEPPIVEQEKYSPEFIQKVAEQSELDKLRGDKKSVEEERDGLKIELDNLRRDKKSVEDERDDLKIELDKLRRDKKSVEDERDGLKTELYKIRRDKKSVEDERDGLKIELDKLRGDKKSVEDERDGLKIELDNLRRDKKSVEDERNALKIELDKIRRDKKSAENERDGLKIELDKLRREKFSVESQLADVRKEKTLAESQRDELSRQLETVYKEKESAEKQLAERFADGWDVYQTFLKLNAEVRENSGLYAESFEAFICSGAQLKRLENVWESALDCKRGGKMSDAQIFWDVFAYCVRLVNAAQGDKIIEILDTQIGDRYDTDKHSTSGTNSSTQGVVREIILAGYRNNTSRKIVKKSNVRVG